MPLFLMLLAAPPPTEEYSHHWAWKAPTRPAVPGVTAKSPIDAFVLAKLKSADLGFSPPATRAHLIRRVTYDLIGLPPTPEEVTAFVNDTSPNAFEKVIDRLLASPHYGERWGRHWLDLARYADSNGYEFDEARPNAWRYRDYVIRSLNEDKPFDRFIIDQIDGGWKLKRMHKLMLMTETYQQSTVAGPPALQKDPENELFSRMNRLRLEGEAVRDSLLFISGRLNPRMGGPGVVPPIPAEATKGSKQAWVVSHDSKEHVRRSVYLFARRNLRHPFLEAFDLPDSNLSCPKRERSTTAPQALALLNATEAKEAATALAERVEKEEDRVGRVYQLVLCRSPNGMERDRASAFLKESPLSELCRALLNMNEFLYLD